MLIIVVMSFSGCHIIDSTGDPRKRGNCMGKIRHLNNVGLKKVKSNAWIEMIELHN